MTQAETETDVRAQARWAYVESVKQGRPLNGVELGERFGRSDSWGRQVIREVKSAQEAVAAEAAGLRPPVRPLSAEPVDSVARVLEERKRTTERKPPAAAAPAEERKLDAWVGEKPPSGWQDLTVRPSGNGRPSGTGNGTGPAEAGRRNGTDVRRPLEPDTARRKPDAEPQRKRQPEPERKPETEAELDLTADSQLPGARFYARTGFMFGTLVSVGANVLQAWLPVVVKPLPEWIEARPEGWSPSWFQQVFAGVWPLALIFAIEVLSRVKWKSGWQWNLARYGGATSVAIFAAVISYGHLYQVLKAFDYGVGAFVGPLVLDGVMVVCGFALLSMTPERKRKRKE